MFNVNSSAVRYTGRWNVTEQFAETTAPGSVIEIAYTGVGAVLHFNILTNCEPYPHLWMIVDDGAKIEVPLAQFLRVEGKGNGNHVIKLIFKSAVERQHRWYQPLAGKVTFLGFEAEGEGVLPPDNRKTIEFIGDSITEGVLVDAEYDPWKLDQPNRVYQDDVTATYAYLTAQAFDLKPVIMGYGAVGITCSGQGSVPKVAEAYPYYYNNAPMESLNAEYIVINHGTNDGRATADEFVAGYEELLLLVRKRNPGSKIASMVPFYGRFRDELLALIPKFNEKYNDDIFIVDTDGWLPKEPVHPGRDGHIHAAKLLTEKLKGWI